MLAITHIAFALALILLLNLNRSEAMVALAFGVFIDIDHFWGLCSYVKAEGLTNISNISDMMASDVQWKSVLHSPVSLAMIVPLSSSFRFFIPTIFWGSHIVMDFMQQNFLGIASPAEFAIFGILLVSIIFLRARTIGKSHVSFKEIPRFMAGETKEMVIAFCQEFTGAISRARSSSSRRMTPSTTFSHFEKPLPYRIFPRRR